MARYRKKPLEIDAVEFTSSRDDILPEKEMPEGIKIERTGFGEPQVYNALHDSWIGLREGDMIRIDQAPNDVYPIDKETFEKTYEKIE